jgi:S1-C subfamily serine protease
VAFFPNIRPAFAVRVRQSTTRDDLAVASVDAAALPRSVPALPLSLDTDSAVIGQSVVMMGYQSGEDRLMVTIPESEQRSLRERCGASVETLLGCLSERNYIKPLTTQGHISDLESRTIVYDARNAVGGSGSPLFGQSGRVIGVNFATFTELPDQNYAVPIRFAVPLLERAGWSAAEPAEEQSANSNTPQPAQPRPAQNTSRPQ